MVEKIGLAATMEMGNFNTGMNQYMKGLDQMGAATSKTGSIMQTALGVFTGGALLGGLKAVGGAILNTGKEAWTAVASYEKMAMSMQSLSRTEIILANTVKETVKVGTARVDITGKEQGEIGKLQKAISDYQFKLQKAAVTQSEWTSKTKESTKMQMAKNLSDWNRELAAATTRVAQLTGKQGALVDITKTVSRVTISDADAKKLAAELAKELLGWSQQLAIVSPFSQEDVSAALKTAMALGFTSKEAQGLTEVMVDFAAATGSSGQVINQVSLALGQIKGKGKLAGQEMLQLVNAGIPVRELLADGFNVTTDAIGNMMEKGLLPADKVIKVIADGLKNRFGGAAKESSQTLDGMKNSLMDLKAVALRELFGGIFESIKPFMSKAIDALTDPKILGQIQNVGQRIGSIAAGLAKWISDTATQVMRFVPLVTGAFKLLFGSKFEGFKGFADTLGSLGLGADQIKRVTDFMLGLRDAIAPVMERLSRIPFVFQTIAGAIGFLVSGTYEGGLKKFIDGLSGLGVGAEKLGAVAQIFRNVRDAISGLVSTFIDATTGLTKGDTVIKVLGALSKLGIPPGLATAIMGIASALGTFTRGIGETWKLLAKGDIGGAFKKMFSTWGELGGDIINALSAIDWGAVWETVKTAATNAIGKAGDFVEKAWPKVKAWFEDTFDSVKDKVRDIDWKAVWDNVRTALADAAGVVGDFAGKAWEKIKAWFTETATMVGDKVGEVDWQTVWERVKEALAEAASKVGDAAQKLGEQIQIWFEQGRDKAQELITGMDMTGISEATRARITEAMAAQKIEAIGQAISNWLINASKWVSENLAPAIEGFAATLTKMAEDMGKQEAGKGEKSPIATALGNAFVSILKAAWGLLTNADLWKAFWDMIVAMVKLDLAVKARIVNQVLEIGASIVEGIVKGIETKAGEVITAIEDWITDNVIEIVKKVIGYGSPAKVFITFGESIPMGLAVGIEAASDVALKAVLGMTDGIIKLVQGMIATVNSMATKPDTGNLSAWAKAITDVLQTMMDTLTGFYDLPGGPKAGRIDLSRRLSKAFSDVIGFVSDMAEGIKALAEVDVAKVTTEKIKAFMARTSDLLTEIVNVAAFWGKTELEIKTKFATARKLADQILDVFRVVADAVDALNAIAEYQVVDEAVMRRKFANWELGVNVALYYIKRVADHWKDVALTTAGAFAEAAGKAMAVVATGVEAITGAAGLKEVSEADLRARFAQWETGVNIAVYTIWRVADFWKKTALDGAIAFAESAGKVLSVISAGLEAITAIADFKPIADLRSKATRFGQSIIEIMQALDDAVKSLVLPSRRGPTVYLTPEEIKAKFADLAAFSEAVQAGIGFIKPAIEAIIGIGTFVPVAKLRQAAASFGEQVLALMDALSLMVQSLTLPGRRGETTRLTPEQITAKFADLKAFSDAVMGAIGFIEPVVKAIVAIGAYVVQAKLGDAITAFKTDMGKVITGMGELAANPALSPDVLDRISAFSQKLTPIVTDLQSGVEALQAMATYKAGSVVTAFNAIERDLNSIFIVLGRMAFNLEGVLGVERATRFEAAANAISGAVTRAMAALGIITGEGAAAKAESFATSITTALGRVTTAMGPFQTNWTNAWAAVTNAIYKALTALRSFKASAASIPIDPNFVGHSPPPLAHWIDAVAEAAQRAKAQFGALASNSYNYATPGSYAYAAQAAAAQAVNVAVNMGGVNISNGMDQVMFEARVTQAVRNAISTGRA